MESGVNMADKFYHIFKYLTCCNMFTLIYNYYCKGFAQDLIIIIIRDFACNKYFKECISTEITQIFMIFSLACLECRKN